MKTAIVVILLLAPSLLKAESIRCGSQLILRGTSSAEMAALCGEPAQVTRTTAYAGSTGRIQGSRGVLEGTAEDIQVEFWTYNFGPDKLMQRVRVENGVVVQIDSLGYGYNEP